MAENLDIVRDIDLVQRCLEGDQHAIVEARAIYLPYLRTVLASRGATEIEIDEITTAVWSDCLMGYANHPPLFERFSGKASLRPWLMAIVVNRWISSKRREKVMQGALDQLQFLQENHCLDGDRDSSDRLVDPIAVEIVAQAIRHAFAECDPEDLVLLRLIHVHEVSRREAAALFVCHESTISRRLENAEREIARSAYAFTRNADSFFELNWNDLLLFSESTYCLRC